MIREDHIWHSEDLTENQYFLNVKDEDQGLPTVKTQVLPSVNTEALVSPASGENQLHYNLFVTLLLGSKAKIMYAKFST